MRQVAAVVAVVLTVASAAFQAAPTRAVARRQTVSTPSTTAKPTPTAVTGCHAHGTTQFCLSGSDEYQIVTVLTATTGLPASYTGCHAHGTDTFCVGPDGNDVEVRLEGAESADGDDHDEHDGDASAVPHEENCHYHAGVKHCVGSSAGDASVCSASEPRQYNLGRRVGVLFAILVGSSIGVFGPIWLHRTFPRNSIVTQVLRVLKQFGTGVVISTAFVHLYSHASLTFANPCIGNLEYEGTVSAIFMAGLILSFLVDYLGQRVVARSRRDKAELPAHDLIASHAHRREAVGLYVLEAGIIFHSIILGVTTVMAPDGFFEILSVVMVFHQMFEGVALGTRLAAAGATPPPLDESDEVSGRDEAAVAVAVAAGAVPTWKKLALASAFALTTPVGMAVGIGVLHDFNGNDRATLLATGTLDAVSAGILAWVGIVEMLAHDYLGETGDMTAAKAWDALWGLGALVLGLVLMSLLGKWA